MSNAHSCEKPFAAQQSHEAFLHFSGRLHFWVPCPKVRTAQGYQVHLQRSGARSQPRKMSAV